MSLTVNALKVLRRRVLRNHYGEKDESPDEAFMRVARVVAAAERFYGKHESKVEQVEQQFFEIQKNLEFLAGKPLIQAGRPHKTMAACFVLPVEDSMESIFSTLKDNILVLKSGGGTGFNFSHLRSRDQRVGSSGEPAAGPVYFLKMYSQAAKVVRDRGGRQMGSMAILNANHPDIKSFIDLKVEDPGISNFNLSVGVSDQFMRKVGLKGENWPLLDPHSQKILEKISAQELFNCIAKRAWENGDPGLLFLDTTEKGNVTPSLGKLEATNVCGEQPLLPYEACNLGHVVLPSFCQNGQVDFKRLEGVVRLGVRFLDDVIDVNYYSLTKIEEMCKGNRKIGLGVMGFADLLIKMGIAYDSREAVEMAEKIMSFITQTARD
ncbi:hypothetical protein B5M47_01820 [candidate division CPR3 bacterium 4484_211]|uniref:Ribonucleoside-diphosphate reductase n=1 Tax=candidate division CPR3 bacterium 4484_211 TaxID=1968527 RepID=A0A1W9NYC5_UNCC3|nr:MAG: hypothetical protein B5M47_01820 [candidate division CPR3 bacterium 4484_211]